MCMREGGDRAERRDSILKSGVGDDDNHLGCTFFRAREQHRPALNTFRMPPWPNLPARAAYLLLNNPRRRNALSLAVLRDLRDQLLRFNTSPSDGEVRILPPFRPDILGELESAYRSSKEGHAHQYDWLVNADAWNKHRNGLPNVLILRSEGPVFSAGHDLGELRQRKLP
jgi:hypothetical protein